MSDGETPMITPETIRYELEGRFGGLQVGKAHLSVRYEEAPRIVRVGACLAEYNWTNRMVALEGLLAFERAHADEFAVEFDIVPLDAVTDEAFAEA
jgi:hypothetical protein